MFFSLLIDQPSYLNIHHIPYIYPKTTYQPIKIKDREIQSVSSFIYLGAVLGTMLHFGIQVDYATGKAKRAMFKIYALINGRWVISVQYVPQNPGRCQKQQNYAVLTIDKSSCNERVSVTGRLQQFV